MTTQTPSLVLQHYARSLALSSPSEWEAFVQCFDAYATDVTLAVTNAPADSVLVAQGKAQAFLHLLRLFRDCNKAAPQQAPTAPPQP